MEKRFIIIFLVIFMSVFFVSSASQKIIISSTTLPISINKVAIDNNVVSVLVESKNSYKEYLMFDVKAQDGTTKRYFSFPKTLGSYEALYFDIPLEVSNPTYLYATPYHQSGSTIVLYDLSKELYAFSGAEYTASSSKTMTTTDTLTATSVTSLAQQYSTVTTTALVSTNTDDKVIYVRGIQKIQDNNLEYLHNDYLGSTRKESNGNTGEQILSSDYYYFGSPLKRYGYNNDYLSSAKKAFTSKEQDDSGLYYFGARYYNSVIGRFLSVDPVYNPRDTPYSYVRNNPLKFVDPTGKELVISQILHNKAGISLYMYFGLLDYFPEFSKLRNKNPGSEVYYMLDFEEMGNFNSKNFVKQSMTSVGSTYPYFHRSYLNIDKLNQDYSDAADIAELITMIHETIHLTDGVIKSKFDEDTPEGQKEIIENEIRVEKRIGEVLNLDKTYQEQLKTKNSWVVKLVFSEEQYSYLAAENALQLDHYKEQLNEVEEQIIPFSEQDIKYTPFSPDEITEFLIKKDNPDKTAVYSPEK